MALEELPRNWGDVRCACRLAYRYAVTPVALLFWPQNSRSGFRAVPIDGDACIACGAPLAPLLEEAAAR